MDWSGPFAERFRPSFSVEPITNRIKGAFSASATRRWKPSFGGGKDKDRHAEEFARNDIDWAANREGDVNAGFSEVERDLCARIAIADHEHPLAGEESRIAISTRMQDRAAERLHARPCGRIGIVGPAGCDDDDGRGSRFFARFSAPCSPVTPHRREQVR